MLITSRKVNFAAASSSASAAVHAAGETPHNCHVTEFALLLAVSTWLFSQVLDDSACLVDLW